MHSEAHADAAEWPDDDRDQRCSGRTTRQMREAPRGATFIWCTRDLDYPQTIARRIDRADLVLQTPGFFDRPAHYWRGAEIPALVVDHAAFGFFTPAQRDGYFRCMTQIESRSK